MDMNKGSYFYTGPFGSDGIQKEIYNSSELQDDLTVLKNKIRKMSNYGSINSLISTGYKNKTKNVQYERVISPSNDKSYYRVRLSIEKYYHTLTIHQKINDTHSNIVIPIVHHWLEKENTGSVERDIGIILFESWDEPFPTRLLTKEESNDFIQRVAKNLADIGIVNFDSSAKNIKKIRGKYCLLDVSSAKIVSPLTMEEFSREMYLTFHNLFPQLYVEEHLLNDRQSFNSQELYRGELESLIQKRNSGILTPLEPSGVFTSPIEDSKAKEIFDFVKSEFPYRFNLEFDKMSYDDSIEVAKVKLRYKVNVLIDEYIYNCFEKFNLRQLSVYSPVANFRSNEFIRLNRLAQNIITGMKTAEEYKCYPERLKPLKRKDYLAIIFKDIFTAILDSNLLLIPYRDELLRRLIGLTLNDETVVDIVRTVYKEKLPGW